MPVVLDNNLKKLNDILEERDRRFPERNPHLSENLKTELDSVVNYIEDQRRNYLWNPNHEIIEVARAMKEEAIFLCGAMKSGSTLLLELLDGHDQLNVLPGDSWFWVRFRDRTIHEGFSNESWRRHWLKRFINPKGQKPFWILGDNIKEYIHVLNYLDYWLNNLPDNPKRPVLATVFSYYCANSRGPGKAKRWVEKTPGNEFKVTSIDRYFPKTKFIHIVRDPRENIASIKRLYRSRSWQWNSRSMIRSLASSYDTAIKNKKKFGKERYLLVQYDDLTKNLKQKMQEIASFIGIEWEDSLTVPTVNSYLTKPNTMFKERQIPGEVICFQKKKWRQELSMFEQGLVHQIENDAKKVGYTWKKNKIDFLKQVVFGWPMLWR